MLFDAHQADWLDEIRELNRLFLTYVQVLAREGQAGLGLPGRVARRLRDAEPATLERLADLPTALFRLRLEHAPTARERIAPVRPTEQMRVSLTLTILSSAWHLARSRAFEARVFLHLSPAAVQRLRATPLSRLPALASAPELLSCAFVAGRLTWPALIREPGPDGARMLLLIALQPELPVPATLGPAAARADLRPLS